MEILVDFLLLEVVETLHLLVVAEQVVLELLHLTLVLVVLVVMDFKHHQHLEISYQPWELQDQILADFILAAVVVVLHQVM
jgi:hypothetical protein